MPDSTETETPEQPVTPEAPPAPAPIEFPVYFAAGEKFTFSYEGATYTATANWPHVFHEAQALQEHLSKASRGQYDGLTIG